MAWFDDLNLPGATIDGFFGYVTADGPDEDDNPDVMLADGTVTFTATTPAARVDGAWLGIQPVTAHIFEGRLIVSEENPQPIRLLATDANIGVADWAWRATFDIRGFTLAPLTFKAPRNTTVNLTADLIPIKSQPYQIIEGASIVDAEVSGEGTMRFELSDGSFTKWMDVPNGERGIAGPEGEPGPQGNPGPAPSLSMGSVSTGTTGDAWMTGTALARELNLTLPRGQKGERGEQGIPGSYAGKGDSAYQVAVTEGFAGTEEQWLATLKGEKGDPGPSYDLGDIPLNSDLNSLHDTRHYAVRTATIANTLANWPDYLSGWPGHLEVMGASNGMTVQRVTGYGSRFSLWTRAVASVNDGAWTDWEQIWPSPATTAWDKGDIATGTDMNTLTVPGLYGVRSGAGADSLINAPSDAFPGTVEVLATSNGITVQRWTYYGPQEGMRLRTTLGLSAGTWTDWTDPWAVPDPAPADSGVAPYSAHTIRQTHMMYAMGGPIDTGGLGAFAWRIDHGWKNFKEKLLPIFRAAGIVPMVTYNPRDWSRTENDGVTATEVNQWVADGWIEISNHGGTHGGGPTGEAEIYDNIVNGLAEIEAELPAAAGNVWGWCQPGGSAGDYDGFQNGSTPDMWDTYAGRLIMQHHAVGYGYSPGTHLRILDGTIRDGLSHITLDSYSVANTKTRIDQAIMQRRGLQVMLHPSLLDEPGYTTTADIQAIVDYVVAKRDAGDLVTLSPYQMMVADSTRVTSRAPVVLRDTGWRSVIPNGPAADPAEPGVMRLRRIEDQVFCRLVGIATLPGVSNAWLAPNQIPAGFTLGGVGQIVDVPGGYGNGAQQPNRAVRHRISIQENDIAYVGYIHNWDGVNVESARDDGSRRIYGALPSWVTDDPWPSTLPGDPA